MRDETGQSRKRLLVALSTATASEGLLEMQAGDDLAAFVDFDIVYWRDLPGLDSFKGKVYKWMPGSKLRAIVWQFLYLARYIQFTRIHYPERMGDVHLWTGYGNIVLKLRGLVGTWLFRIVAYPLMRWFMKKTNPLSTTITDDYDAVMSISGLKDPLCDDLMMLAKERGLPSLIITQNWDNINYKPFNERPTKVGVWGLQGYYTARMIHGFEHSDIIPTGSPRLEIYHGDLPEKAAAREALGLPADKRLILLAGSGISFEETSLVEMIDRAICDGTLPVDCMLLYKPHPRRWDRTNEKPIEQAELHHTRIVPSSGDCAVRGTRMPELLRAVDVVVSPYSTVILEAAFCGTPVVAIGWDHPDHANYTWKTMRTMVYLGPLWFGEWCVNGLEKKDLVADVGKALALVGREDVAIKARQDVLHVVHNDQRSVGERIASVLIDITMKPK